MQKKFSIITQGSDLPTIESYKETNVKILYKKNVLG